MPAPLVALLLALLARENLAIGSEPELDPAAPNSTAGPGGNSTSSGGAQQKLLYSIAQYLPTLRTTVIAVCGFTSFLVLCLVIRICRSGKKIRKTRKYDIITTPAERVEMAPLNEENEDDEDSTVFDVKYRYR